MSPLPLPAMLVAVAGVAAAAALASATAAPAPACEARGPGGEPSECQAPGAEPGSSDTGVLLQVPRRELAGVKAKAKVPNTANASALRRAGAGAVEALWTIGSPGSAKPALQNWWAGGDDPCFEGTRSFQTQGAKRDGVTVLAYAVKFGHPWMEAEEVENGTGVTPTPCSKNVVFLPPLPPPSLDLTELSVSLHSSELYAKNLAKYRPNSMQARTADLCAYLSYEPNLTNAIRTAWEYGWTLVGAAYHPGTATDEDKTTLECVITFTGTHKITGALTDIEGAAVPFCGLTDKEEGETCAAEDGGCGVQQGHSFVHNGFRDHLRRMTQEAGFETFIASKLPSCSKVHVTGHSLGAAMAELFTACVNRAPPSGTYGADDYTYMNWQPGEAKLLPEINASRPMYATVKTKEQYECSTDDYIYLSLEGKGAPVPYQLLDKAGIDDFQYGDIDTYSVAGPTDQLQKVCLAKKLYLTPSPWCPESVTIYDNKGQILGVASNWPGSISSQEPVCSDVAQPAERTGLFSVTVRTKGATNCNTMDWVYARLKGAAGFAGEWQYLHSGDPRDPFSRNDVRTLTIVGPASEATELCFKKVKAGLLNDGWCPGQMTVRRLGAGAPSQADGFDNIDDQDVHCRPLAPAPQP